MRQPLHGQPLSWGLRQPPDNRISPFRPTIKGYKPRLHLYIIDGGRDTKTTDHSLMGVGKSSFMDEIIRPNTGCGERIQDVADPGCGERGGGGGAHPSKSVHAGLS